MGYGRRIISEKKNVDKLYVFALLDVYLLKNQRNSKILDFKVSIFYTIQSSLRDDGNNFLIRKYILSSADLDQIQ